MASIGALEVRGDFNSYLGQYQHLVGGVRDAESPVLLVGRPINEELFSGSRCQKGTH